MTPVCEFMYAQAAKMAELSTNLHYLEIGVQEGNSLWSVLRCQAVALAVGVDIWNDDSGGTNRGNANHIAERFGDDMRRVVIVSGDSHHVLPGLHHPFDMLFVDGDHSEIGCLADLNGCLRLVRDCRHARIYVDDLDHPKHTYLHEATERWASEHSFGFAFHPIGYGVGELWLAKYQAVEPATTAPAESPASLQETAQLPSSTLPPTAG